MDEKEPNLEKEAASDEPVEETVEDEGKPLLAESPDAEGTASIVDELQAFSGLEDLTEDDLKDLQDAIAENVESDNIAVEMPFAPDISADLEKKMQEELARKKKSQDKSIMTKEMLMDYLSSRRSKIVYHALWYLTFTVEDHEAAKDTLYEALKEVTSKNAVEPLDEHKFYFGLGFILRLTLNSERIVQFKAGKLKLAVNPEFLKEILNQVGDPISERPIITQSKKDEMFADFLKDDFLDI